MDDGVSIKLVPTSITGEWFQAGPDFYRLPLMEHVPEPSALSGIPYNWCEVVGAPEKAHFLLLTSIANAMVAFDMCTGGRLYVVSNAGYDSWLLWPEQLLAGRREWQAAFTLHSLIDGSVVPHTLASDAADNIVVPPHSWQPARNHPLGALLNTECLPPIVLCAPNNFVGVDRSYGQLVAISKGEGTLEDTAQQHMRHLTVPKGAACVHSDTLFFIQYVSALTTQWHGVRACVRVCVRVHGFVCACVHACVCVSV